MNEELKSCINNCFDEGIQQTETLCAYCQSYFDSVMAEALREYKVSPEYWAWHDRREKLNE